MPSAFLIAIGAVIVLLPLLLTLARWVRPNDPATSFIESDDNLPFPAPSLMRGRVGLDGALFSPVDSLRIRVGLEDSSVAVSPDRIALTLAVRGIAPYPRLP